MTDFRGRMRKSAEEHNSRVVLALDISGPHVHRLEGAMKVLTPTKSRVAAVKLNQQLLLPFGLEGVRGLVSVCKSEGLPLIADLKLNDIESTNLNVVETLLDYGFDAVIANPLVGKEEGLGRATELMHSQGGGMILLVYMSHGGAKEGYGLQMKDGDPLYKVFARRAKEWGADGVVVSAKNPEKVKDTREIVGEECLIFSPGVGAQGGKRGVTSAGADFLIVGRSITEVTDPGKALLQFNSS